MARRYMVLAVTAAAVALAVWLPPDTGAAESVIRDGSWTGQFTLPVSAGRVQVDLQLHGSTGLVALGPGHAALQRVSVRRGATTLAVALPGAPAPLRFNLVLRGSALRGSVVQGSHRGTARLRPGKPTLNRFLGSYRTANGDTFIVLDLTRLGVPPWIIDSGTDSLRALYRTGAATYAVGAGVAHRDPVSGTLHFATDGSGFTESLANGTAVSATRLAFRAREVWLHDGKIPLAGTLLLPAGAGPFPAVVMAHGAGPSLRDEGQTFSNFLASQGIASLTMDKRGNGQSGGTYLGDFAGENAVAGYAADVVAGGHFLARQPDIDPHHIGLFGGSQAGWVIPRAAVGAGDVFSFAVILSGPVVSQGESDFYASLCNQGNAPASMTPDQIDAAVRAEGPSGVDPLPDLRRLRIPILWIYGGLDQNQPTRLDLPVLARLKAETGADLRWVVFPQANHGLVTTQTGLNSEAAAAPGYARGLFVSLVGWLRAHVPGSAPGTAGQAASRGTP